MLQMQEIVTKARSLSTIRTPLSSLKKIESEIWDLHFQSPIHALQRRIKLHQRNAKAKAQLENLLESAAGFYLQRVHEICSTLGLDVACCASELSYVSPAEVFKVSPAATRKSLKERHAYLAHVCLMRLGDIARHGERFSHAKNFYQGALELYRKGGELFNQMAQLEAAVGEELTAVFNFGLSLTAQEPFLPAKANLQRLFSKILTAGNFEGDPKNSQGSPRDYIQRFLYVHASLYSGCNRSSLENNLEELEKSLQVLILDKKLDSGQLLEMAAINIFAWHHAKTCSDREPDTPFMSSLLAGMLAALLRPFASFLSHLKRDYFLCLPALKIILEWICYQEPSLLGREEFQKRAGMWRNLCELLNHYIFTLPEKWAELESRNIPLPEDWHMNCCSPIARAHARLNFDENQWDSGFPEAAFVIIRASRLVFLGLILTKLLGHSRLSLTRKSTFEVDHQAQQGNDKFWKVRPNFFSHVRNIHFGLRLNMKKVYDEKNKRSNFLRRKVCFSSSALHIFKGCGQPIREKPKEILTRKKETKMGSCSISNGPRYGGLKILQREKIESKKVNVPDSGNGQANKRKTPSGEISAHIAFKKIKLEEDVEEHSTFNGASSARRTKNGISEKTGSAEEMNERIKNILKAKTKGETARESLVKLKERGSPESKNKTMEHGGAQPMALKDLEERQMQRHGGSFGDALPGVGAAKQTGKENSTTLVKLGTDAGQGARWGGKLDETKSSRGQPESPPRRFSKVKRNGQWDKAVQVNFYNFRKNVEFYRSERERALPTRVNGERRNRSRPFHEKSQNGGENWFTILATITNEMGRINRGDLMKLDENQLCKIEESLQEILAAIKERNDKKDQRAPLRKKDKDKMREFQKFLFNQVMQMKSDNLRLKRPPSVRNKDCPQIGSAIIRKRENQLEEETKDAVKEGVFASIYKKHDLAEKDRINLEYQIRDIVDSYTNKIRQLIEERIRDKAILRLGESVFIKDERPPSPGILAERIFEERCHETILNANSAEGKIIGKEISARLILKPIRRNSISFQKDSSLAGQKTCIKIEDPEENRSSEDEMTLKLRERIKNIKKTMKKMNKLTV